MATITEAQRKQILEKLNKYYTGTYEGIKAYDENARHRLHKVYEELIDSLSEHAPWDIWDRIGETDITTDKYDDNRLIMKVWLNDSLVRSSLLSGRVDLFQLVNNYVSIKKNTPVGIWHGMIIKGSRTPTERSFGDYVGFVHDSFFSAHDFAEKNGIRIGYSRSYYRDADNIVDNSGYRDPVGRYSYIYNF